MEWRSLLYLPLGTLPLIFFSLRMLVQWWQSERKGDSVVTPLFWQLSLAGNCLLFLHYYVQMQAPFALVQLGNALIAWRNLDLMKRRHPFTLSQVLAIFLSVFFLVLFIFGIQGFLDVKEMMRVPLKPWDKVAVSGAPLLLQILGVFGGFLFAGRFWIQWWRAERLKQSELSQPFWVASLLGSFGCLLYFFWIQDLVSLSHYGFALIPSFRNLWLIKRKKSYISLIRNSD